jgi:DNA-binding response OmpR family regulator
VHERVLLVEDDASIRETMALGLEAAGFRVTGAADGREGLAEFRSRPYDLVVLDVMLPELDGLEACRQIRRDSQVPIVMLSARSDTVDVVVGLELGADDYVTKPFELAELVARVRAAIRRASAAPAQGTLSVANLEMDRPRIESGRTAPTLRSRRRSSASYWSSHGVPARSSPVSCCSSACGATSTSATRASWTSPSSGSARRSRTTPRNRA